MPRQRESPSPPSATFNFMSGNFDFPPASASPPPAPREPRASSNTLYQRHVSRLEREGLSGVPESESAPNSLRRRPRGPAISSRSLRQARLAERELTGSSSVFGRPPEEDSRPRATPSSRYLRRSTVRLRDQRPADLDSTDDVLDSLHDIPIPNPFTAAAASASGRLRPPADEPDAPRRQTKRRKLEHGPSQSWDYFKYGHKGQVVAARLKMEIVSCDGGEYPGEFDARTPYGKFPIQNVLKNDKSVYCSERSRCNLLLKHIGEMPFTLEKVVIRAPDRGFTAPVQEGLIFVAMSADDILSATSAYKIDYSSPSPPVSRPSSSGEHLLSLREAIDDPYVWDNSRTALQETMEEGLERMRLRNRRLRVENSVRADLDSQREERQNTDDQDEFVLENCEEPEDETYAMAAGVSAPTPPPFTISTESDDDSEDNEEVPSAAIMADRLRREARWRAESEDESDELYRFAHLRPSSIWDPPELSTERRPRNPIRAPRLQTPSRIEPKEGPSDSEPPIAPHAKFFIAKHKNKITIKFHPAISGKFVLLKLWSPTHDGNIDIETVQFYGYSGPRYFPAVQPR